MKRILITGAAGNIGFELQQKLTGELTLLDKKDISYNTIHKAVQLDLIDRIATKKFFSVNEFDVIIHLSAISRVIEAEKNPIDTYKNNVVAVENIIDAIADKGTKPHIIFTSSREVYGASSTETPFFETSHCRPQNVYGKSKYEAEKILQKYATLYNIPVTILRLANVYGGENDISSRFVPQLLSAINRGTRFTLYGNSKHIDFVHITDVVSIFSAFVSEINKQKKYEIYNIASGNSIKLEELIDFCYKYIGEESYSLQKESSSDLQYEVESVYLNNCKITEKFSCSFKHIQNEITKMITIKQEV